MLPTASDDCDDGCVPAYMRSRKLQWHSLPSIAATSIPFVLTFALVSTLAIHKLYPALALRSSPSTDADHRMFTASRGSNTFEAGVRRWATGQRLSALTFAATIALAAVLAELILCEISNAFDPVARTLVLRLTISSLLVLLLLVTPALGWHSVIRSAGWEFTPRRRGGMRCAWVLEAVGMAIWLCAFWWIGHGLPGTHRLQEQHSSRKPLREACLERIGIIGISLMALLSGFASVSSLWQTFGIRVRPVTEADIARKQSGLEATHELLESKLSRMRALDRKLSDAPDQGFMTKMLGSLRGNADVQERKTLQMEISGLETMSRSLTTSLAMLRNRRRDQQRSSTATGRLLLLVSYIFSLYCLYRILATSLATSRRWWRPETTFSGTDPINNLLALIAKHWDPSLDRLAWSRQIAFLLSGVILLASFNSVLQTFQFFSRFAPAVLHHAHANLPLLIGQISATYVISSALLLRSNLPKEVGSVISDALGAPLDSAFVDRWFESWFLTASGLTAVGILLVRKVSGGGSDDMDDDDEYDVELGDKRS
ncbi:MAG: hypothetical protein M1823_002387 [Watsoniomyces obsoletus]|nr:MAG: hypothetical protein M1823_002387 [Watsoniomyces obsoletus]